MNRYAIILLALFIFSGLYGQNTEKKKELSLKEAIQIGLNNNPEIKAAQEKISAAKGRFRRSISLPMPELSKNFEYTPKGKSLNSSGEKSLEFSQSFDFPTNYFIKGSKSSLEENRTLNEFRQAGINIISEIKTAYYNLIACERKVLIAQENLEIAQDFYKKAEIRSNIGEGTNLEKLTAKVQVTEAGNNLEIQKNHLKSANTKLYYLFGNCAGGEQQIYLLTDTLGYIEMNLTIEEILNRALKENPQLRISELSTDIAVKDKTLAWSSLLPSFNLSYYKQTLDGNPDFYGASFGISIPLWFMFDQSGEIQEANANLNIAEAEHQNTKNLTYLKICNAYNDFKNTGKQLELYVKEIIPQTEEIFRIALKSYEAGEINYLEYLQSKFSLIKSKNDFIDALLSYNTAISNLEQSAGIDLSISNNREN